MTRKLQNSQYKYICRSRAHERESCLQSLHKSKHEKRPSHNTKDNKLPEAWSLKGREVEQTQGLWTRDVHKEPYASIMEVAEATLLCPPPAAPSFYHRATAHPHARRRAEKHWGRGGPYRGGVHSGAESAGLSVEVAPASLPLLALLPPRLR
jgi:hypothetical protein